MSNAATSKESEAAALMLFVTGSAPRSVRARKNLARALEALGMDWVEAVEIDLLASPEQTVTYSVFATPALVRTNQTGQIGVLYGDLSESTKLLEFLRDLA